MTKSLGLSGMRKGRAWALGGLLALAGIGNAIAEENQIEICHFPVYETSPAPVDEEKFKALEHPVAWHFYSGKAVLALKRFIQKSDVVHLHGASAEKAFKSVKASL